MNEFMPEEPEVLYGLQVESPMIGRRFMVSDVRYFVTKPNGEMVYLRVGQEMWESRQLKPGEYLTAKVMRR
jgi:hypothetical protein